MPDLSDLARSRWRNLCSRSRTAEITAHGLRSHCRPGWKVGARGPRALRRETCEYLLMAPQVQVGTKEMSYEFPG